MKSTILGLSIFWILSASQPPEEIFSPRGNKIPSTDVVISIDIDAKYEAARKFDDEQLKKARKAKRDKDTKIKVACIGCLGTIVGAGITAIVTYSQCQN